MIVGFTGSRKRMTAEQKEGLTRLLEVLKPTQFHHGDCIGADAAAHEIATLFCMVYIHPPVDPKYRAYCASSHTAIIYPTRPYLDRNRDIVKCADVLIAAPDGPERLRSGTWATIRYALKKPITVHIL